MKRWWIVIGVVVLIAGAVWWWSDDLLQSAFGPTESELAPGVQEELVEEAVTVVAQDLSIPWELAWLPDGTLLVTERTGRLVQVGDDVAVAIGGVEHVGEGGLLGLAVHPSFTENQFIYLYLTFQVDDGLINRVERHRLVDNQLLDRTVILDQIPGARWHDGGKIAFGPDGLLYITTGDAGQEALAQDRDSLAGKVLRLHDDGTVPADNPFGTLVYSYGHRNSQGLAWDASGQLWSTEHGRSGVQSGLDEINVIEPGANYGWPVIEGDEQQQGMVSPIVHSGPDETWAPAGAAIVGDRLFWAGLRGESLYEAQLSGRRVTRLRRHFTGDWGRLRAVAVGPDDFLYVTTSNQDGRGEVQPGDDKIIRIDPAVLRDV